MIEFLKVSWRYLSWLYPFPRSLIYTQEGELLSKWAGGCEALVEIGAYEGAAAVPIRRAMSSRGTLHLIDPFVPDSIGAHKQARKWMAKYNVARVKNGRVIWHEDFSYDVAKKWSEPIDFLFIDGDHTESACERDWLDWSTHVKVGGVVLFHDARLGLGDGTYFDGWSGPTNVVNKYFRGPHALSNWSIQDEALTIVVVQRKA